ncbi:MAG: DNA polymerase III subunit delta [Elusimicrobiales bacterium]
MKIKSEDELTKDIESLKFDPIYILTGFDTERKKEAINKIKNKIKSEFDWIEHNPTDQSVEFLLSDLMTPPLFSTRRIIIINSFEKIKSTIKNDIIEYFKKPNNSTVLFVMHNEDLKNYEIKKLYDEFEVSIVPFFEPSEDEIKDILNAFFESKKINASQEIISLISTSVINHSHLKREIEKLNIYLSGKREININEISRLITPLKETDIFELSDAIISNNPERFKEIISQLIETRREPLEIIGAIEYTLEKIIKIKALYKRFTEPPYEILSLLSLTRYDISKIKPYTVEKILEEKIISLLEMCLTAENNLKSQTQQDGYIIIRNISHSILENLMNF